jgi:hypothetical protein
MATLKKQPVEGQCGNDPDIVGALRDWLVQDHRVAVTESDPDRSSSSSTPDRTPTEEADSAQPGQDRSADAESSSANAHQAPSDFHIAPPLQGPYGPDPHEANFPADVSDDSVANRHSPDGPEEHVAAVRPRLRAPEPQPEVRRAFSVTRRIADTLAYGFVVVAVAGVVVAFLSDDNLRLTGGSIRSPTPENQGASSVTNQLNPVLQPQQLEKIANDLASLQQTVERLAARQDEMERNIATLQASNPSIQSRRHHRNR